MPEVTITYEKPETLKILKALAKYLDFKMSSSATKKKEKSLDDILVPGEKAKEFSVNGVTMIPGDPSIDITELRKIFTEKNLDAKKLREEAWRRPK